MKQYHISLRKSLLAISLGLCSLFAMTLTTPTSAQISLGFDGSVNGVSNSTDSSSQSQDGRKSEEEVKKDIYHYATIMSMTIGYAKFCKFPEDKINTIATPYYQNLELLAEKFKQEVKKESNEVEIIASNKGPELTKQTCEGFGKEFNKIYESVILQMRANQGLLK